VVCPATSVDSGHLVVLRVDVIDNPLPPGEPSGQPSASIGLANVGSCSDSIFYNYCMDNIEAYSGDFAVCNMCMCKEHQSYGGTRSCAADPVLFACYISEDNCRTKLRQQCIIIFSAFGLCNCILLGIYWRMYCLRHIRSRGKTSFTKVYAAEQEV
jgi:hypothetical protein